MGLWDRVKTAITGPDLTNPRERPKRPATPSSDGMKTRPITTARGEPGTTVYTPEPEDDQQVRPLELLQDGKLKNPADGMLATNLAKWELWRQVGVARASIVGEQYHNVDHRSPELACGRRLLLVAEPDNPHDPKAIAVKTESGTTVGYIKKGSTARFRKRQREDGPIMLVSRGATHNGDHTQVRAFLVSEGALSNVPFVANEPLE